MTRGEELNGHNKHGARLSGRTKGWNHWTTPHEVLHVVRNVGPIALDPCSNEKAEKFAAVSFDGVEKNGLTESWEVLQAGLVFVNPPYSTAADWVKKCILEAVAGREIIALVAARTDTRWAHGIFQTAQSVCFWGPGRIKFGNPPEGSDGNAPSIPSMFAYWGPVRREPSRFIAAFKDHGKCMDLTTARASFPVRVRP